jgi:hypothetical protein
MGKMPAEEKAEMMSKMMDNFMSDLKPEDRQKMMDDMMTKFMSSMSDQEKQSMMQNMMPKMMGGNDSMKQGGMMGMMKMMMGGNMSDMMSKMMGTNSEDKSDDNSDMPWDMCKKMMSGIGKANDLATFATPEIRTLFEEWVMQIEDEILNFVKDSETIEVDKISEHFKISNDSTTYILTRLAQKGKIKFKK